MHAHFYHPPQMHAWGQVKVSGKDKGHKTLGKDAAAWQLAQLLFCLGLGVVTMLSSIGMGLPMHSRAIAAAFGIVYALQVLPLWLSFSNAVVTVELRLLMWHGSSSLSLPECCKQLVRWLQFMHMQKPGYGCVPVTLL